MNIEIEGLESLCRRARAMIEDGADPEMPAVWTRNDVPVFVEVHPLAWWAARMAVERDLSVKIVPYTPSPSRRRSPEIGVGQKSMAG